MDNEPSFCQMNFIAGFLATIFITVPSAKSFADHVLRHFETPIGLEPCRVLCSLAKKSIESRWKFHEYRPWRLLINIAEDTGQPKPLNGILFIDAAHVVPCLCLVPAACFFQKCLTEPSALSQHDLVIDDHDCNA